MAQIIHGKLEMVPESISLPWNCHLISFSFEAPTILDARQSSGGSNNGCSGTISGGGVAGIVIGSVAGTLLLIWLWKLCTLPGARSGSDSDYGYVPNASKTRRNRRRGRSPSIVEYVEKSRSRPRYGDELRRPAKVYTG